MASRTIRPSTIGIAATSTLAGASDTCAAPLFVGDSALISSPLFSFSFVGHYLPASSVCPCGINKTGKKTARKRHLWEKLYFSQEFEFSPWCPGPEHKA
jgi:hypothetical protein